MERRAKGSGRGGNGDCYRGRRGKGWRRDLE